METLAIATPPASLPVSLAEAKLHLRVEEDFSEDDALIASLIGAATDLAERRTKSAFVARSYAWTIDAFPGRLARDLSPAYGSSLAGRIEARAYPWSRQGLAIALPRPPLISVASIAYLDPSGDEQALDPGAYRVLPGTPGRIVPARGSSWPATPDDPGAVTITFAAGFGDAADVPDAVKAAIKLLVGTWYRNRESAAPGTLAELPMGVAALLNASSWGFYG